LSFAVCVSGLPCHSVTAPELYFSIEDCEFAGDRIVAQAQADNEAGEFTIEGFTCRVVEWGR
jgi:hypothetical protein